MGIRKRERKPRMRMRKTETARDLGWVNFKAPQLVGIGWERRNEAMREGEGQLRGQEGVRIRCHVSL